MLDIKRALAAKPKPHEDVKLARLTTPWGQDIDPACVLPEHPTPQFARAHYEVLHGWWDCAFVAAADATPDPDHLPLIVDAAPMPAPDDFAGKILVPFSPEAPLSGVCRQLQPGELLWYRRRFAAPALAGGDRLLLHFQAVDHTCSVRVNGTCVGGHAGGYSPFAFDITNYLVEGENELAVCVADPTEAGGVVRGKQRLDRGDIWYTAQSGIWQPVWLEAVPANRIDKIDLAADALEGSITVRAFFRDSEPRAHVSDLAVEIRDADGSVVAADAFPAPDESCSMKFRLKEPRAWTPEDPHLYRILFTYGSDVVSSYCGLRTVEVKRDGRGHARLFLNGEPRFLKGVLDQGYWPDGLMTAPSDAALVADVEAARDAGFNLMRKHLKVESARWYHHCDRLGMLVWQDMPSGGAAGPLSWQWSYKPTLFKASWNRFADDTPKNREALGAGSEAYREEWLRTCEEAIEHLKGHPCIVAWGLFNEGWGQFDSATACERAKELDPTRPVDAASGWYDQGAGEFKSAHNYFRPLKVWPDAAGRAFVISECGGLTLHVAGHCALPEAYGYAAFEDSEAWANEVRAQLARLDGLEKKGLAGYVWTQLTDVEEETNGIITYDRLVNKLERA